MIAILLGGPLDGQTIDVTKSQWSYQGYYRALDHQDCAVFILTGVDQLKALPMLVDLARSNALPMLVENRPLPEIIGMGSRYAPACRKHAHIDGTKLGRAGNLCSICGERIT